MKDKTVNSIGRLDFKSEELKIIHTYRYFSWFFTSLFYFFGNLPSHWIFKLSVIVLLYISVKITIEIYNRYETREKNDMEKSFIFIETIGIIFILLPTGGVNSPFIWYALNPVLISAVYLSYYFSWFNLISYLCASITISYFFYNPTKDSINIILSKHSHLILIFILITLAVQLLAKLSSQLRNQSIELLKTNIELNKANMELNKSMEHIMSLYQTVEAITSQDNKNKIYQTFAEYTAKLTGTDTGFFWPKDCDEVGDIIYISNTIPKTVEDTLISNIEEICNDTFLSNKIFKISIEDYNFNVISVKSTSKSFGLMGFKTDISPSEIIEEHVNKLKFLSELSAIILERFHLEGITEKLMISEEQNRIANEMHDSVAQELFSISYAVHYIIENWKRMTNPQLEEKLHSLQASAHSAMKELRTTIYRLSSRKGGEKSFQSSIRDYLQNVSKLNNVDIKFDIKGDEESVSISKKRGIYRIVCEATGNAIRHGKCKFIEVDLYIDNRIIELNISDNGEGFETNQINKEDAGLGLNNMKRLVELFDGQICINSELGGGATINILMPNTNIIERKEGDLAI